MRAPALSARRMSARAAAPVDEVDDGRESPRDRAGSASGSSRPTGVQLTRHSARTRWSTRRTPRTSARCGVRARTRDLGPGALERPDDGAGAAAGAEDERGSRRLAERGERPGASVLSASIVPSSRKVSVFAAPICARACRSTTSATRIARSLCGIVTLAPANPACGQRADGLGEQLGRDRQALVAVVVEARRARTRPGASRASGCARPASRGRRSASSPTVGGRLPAAALALLVVGLDVALELRVGRGEVVGAVAVRLDDVEEVVDARRVRGGLDRVEARAADRRRRQAGALARVVGRVDVQLGRP